MSKDKEALRNSILDVIRKKPKNGAAAAPNKNSVMPRESGIGASGLNSGMNTGMGAAQGYGGAAGPVQSGTMMAMQQAPAAYQYPNAQSPPLQNAQA